MLFPPWVDAEDMRRGALAWIDILERRHASKNHCKPPEVCLPLATVITVLPGGLPAEMTLPGAGLAMSTTHTAVADATGSTYLQADFAGLFRALLGLMSMWVGHASLPAPVDDTRRHGLDPVTLHAEMYRLIGIHEAPEHKATCEDMRKAIRDLKQVPLEPGEWRKGNAARAWTECFRVCKGRSVICPDRGSASLQDGDTGDADRPEV